MANDEDKNLYDLDFSLDEVPDQWGEKLPQNVYLDGEITAAAIRENKSKDKDQVWLDCNIKGKNAVSGDGVFGTASFMVGKDGQLNPIGLRTIKASVLAAGKKAPGKLTVKGLPEFVKGLKIKWLITPSEQDDRYNDYRAMTGEEFTARVGEATKREALRKAADDARRKEREEEQGSGGGKVEDDSDIPF